VLWQHKPIVLKQHYQGSSASEAPTMAESLLLMPLHPVMTINISTSQVARKILCNNNSCSITSTLLFLEMPLSNALREREQRMAARASPRRSLRIQTLRTTQLLIANTFQSTSNLHLILHSPFNPLAGSPTDSSSKSPFNSAALTLNPQEAASFHNERIPLIRAPLEVLHRIASHLPATSILDLKYTCRSTFLNLSYQQANFVWYDAVAPALLRRWQYWPGRKPIGIERSLCILGAPYSDDINYQYELMQYMKTSKRCCKCLGKLSVDERLAGLGWGKPGKIVCRPCFDEFRIVSKKFAEYVGPH
jgi:hypothetical protein